MITFEEAQRFMREHVKVGRIIEQPILDSLGLVLAKPITARADSPRFDVSAVDGYAVSLKDFDCDLPVTLPVLDKIHAGASSRKNIKAGCAHRIFTGAPVPKGTDAIVMQEDTTLHQDKVTFHRMPKLGSSIRKRGAEFKRGEMLFAAGTIITPSVAQALAACGFPNVRVHHRPIVSIIVTGDELQPSGTKLMHGEIWDSNSIGLQAALTALGISEIFIQRVSDNARSTTKAVQSALEHSDLVIATGGVSVGDRDYVKEAFAANGVREIFWQVSMKPGKPLYFGMKRHEGTTKYVFGLPGNPVSVMATYLLFVRHALLRMIGNTSDQQTNRGILSQSLKKADSRTEFVRAYRESLSEQLPTVIPLSARDSHMTSGMAKADCLIVFPLKQEFIEAGSEVEIIPIQWGAYYR